MKTIFIICFMALSTPYLYSQEGKQFNYEKLAHLSSSELIKKGNLFYSKNEEDSALIFYWFLSAKYDVQMNKSEQYLCALSCNKLGAIFYQKGNYSKAFDAFQKGLRICEKNDFMDILPKFYNNIGTLYFTYQDFNRGIVNYEKALVLSKHKVDWTIEIEILSNLVGTCYYTKDTKKARTFYSLMKDKYKGKKNIRLEYYYLLDLGIIYAVEQKYDSAVACFKASVEYAVRFHMKPLYKSSSFFQLARVYEAMGKNDSALYYLNQNLEITKDNNQMGMLAESLKSLARIYTQRGDISKGQLYKGQYLTVSDSIFNSKELSRMNNVQFMYEMDQMTEHLERLNKEKIQKEERVKTQQKVLFYISLVLCAFIVMLMVVYYQKRKLRLAYKDMFKRNSEILKSEERSRISKAEYENRLAEERTRNKELIERVKQMIISEKELVEIISETENCTEQNDEAKELYSVDKLTGEQKDHILRSIQEIMENSEVLCDGNFTIERLATLIDSNSRYISQVINDTYGKNFRTYISEYRIKEAQLRLMNTAVYGNYTIKAIAESVGYKSHTNFNIIFKKMTGMTPSMYQKIAMQEKMTGL